MAGGELARQQFEEPSLQRRHAPVVVETPTGQGLCVHFGRDRPQLEFGKESAVAQPVRAYMLSGKPGRHPFVGPSAYVCVRASRGGFELCAAGMVKYCLAVAPECL